MGLLVGFWDNLLLILLSASRYLEGIGGSIDKLDAFGSMLLVKRDLDCWKSTESSYNVSFRSSLS